MKNDDLITRKMLSVIREDSLKGEGKKLISEENEPSDKDNGKNGFKITKNTPQFGDIRVSQEEALVKTIGESIELDEDALVFYPSSSNEGKNLVLTGKINSINVVFQFRFIDKSGDGCYVWADSLQLTDPNRRTIGKIKDAFDAWKKNLVTNGDLFDKLEKAANK